MCNVIVAVAVVNSSKYLIPCPLCMCAIFQFVVFFYFAAWNVSQFNFVIRMGMYVRLRRLDSFYFESVCWRRHNWLQKIRIDCRCGWFCITNYRFSFGLSTTNKPTTNFSLYHSLSHSLTSVHSLFIFGHSIFLAFRNARIPSN